MKRSRIAYFFRLSAVMLAVASMLLSSVPPVTNAQRNPSPPTQRPNQPELFAPTDVQPQAITIEGFSDETVFGGLTNPTSIRFASDGRVFVAEKSGLIKVYSSLNATTPTIFADLRTEVYDFWDRGLLGLELDPNFPDSPYAYVSYSLDAPIGGTPPVFNDACADPTGNGCVTGSRLARLTANGNTATNQLILVEDWCIQYPSHTVGDVRFGPDGALYASGGDGASFTFIDYGQQGNPCGDPPNEGGSLRAQDIATPDDPTGLDGTIIRVNPQNGSAFAGNPLIGGDKADDDQIVAYGMRNPFRFTFRPNSSELWLGDVGSGTWEEINRLTDITTAPAKNFGWPCFEGTGPEPGFEAANLPMCQNLYSNNSSQQPYYQYNHNGQTSSTTGISFYDGSSYPTQYQGALFFADYSQQWIKAMLPGANGLPNPDTIETIATEVTPVALQSGPGGDIFYVDMGKGEIHRIRYSNGNTPPQAVIATDKTYGSLPLRVRFDGTGSTDPDSGDSIRYSWDLNGDARFGDSTSATPTFTYRQNRNYTVSLRVTDNSGATDTDSVTISAGNTPPTTAITSPTSTTTYKVGDTISFSGSASDSQDGTLPASAYSWQTIIYHCSIADPDNCHQHFLQQSEDISSGSFIAPDHEYPSHIELNVTVTDSRGLTASSSVSIQPQTVILSFATEPSGLSLVVYGRSQAAPFDKTVIAGGKATLSAPSPQAFNGSNYVFQSWSDGGSQTHEVTVAENGTYTATYVAEIGENEQVWRSYDVQTQAGTPQGTVNDHTGANPASLEFYVSTNPGGVDQGSLFSTFNTAANPDLANRVERYWANEAGVSYTYAGKSTVDRGSDTDESNAPAPLGARDLQLHPPNSDNLVVAALTIPVAGDYSLSGLATRRVDSNPGQSATYKVFNKDKSQITSLTTTSPVWVTDPSVYNLGTLQAGEKVYFAVDRDGGYWWDFTEIAWTLRRTGGDPPPPPPPAQPTWHSYDIQTQAGSPQGTVVDVATNKLANLEFYVSTNPGGVDQGGLFTTFNAGANPDLANRVENYWANETGVSYTYAGKSTIDRGGDTGETNAPAPLGVRDLQLHPPNTDNLVVVAFIVPESGDYSISGLAARRVDGNASQTSTFKVFDHSKLLLESITATSQSWASSSTTHQLTSVNAGDKIYFAVDRDGGYWWDFTEIAWTITQTKSNPPTTPVTLESQPSGVKIMVDGQVQTTPYTLPDTNPHTVTALSPQTTADGQTLQFSRWSDGGSQSRQVTPESGSSLTIEYNTASSNPLFANGFEEGDTSAYPQGNIDIVAGNRLEVNSTHPHTGTYSLDVSSDGTGVVTQAVIDQIPAKANTMYVRTHFSLAEANLQPGQLLNFLVLKNENYRRLAYVSLNSNYQLELRLFDPAQEGYCEPDMCGQGRLIGAYGPEIARDNLWHDLQIRYTVDKQFGAVELWLDGTRIAELYGLDTGTAATDDINVITWGTMFSSHDIVTRMYFDDLSFGHTYLK